MLFFSCGMKKVHFPPNLVKNTIFLPLDVSKNTIFYHYMRLRFMEKKTHMPGLAQTTKTIYFYIK